MSVETCMVRKAGTANRDISGILRLIKPEVESMRLLSRTRGEIEAIIDQGRFWVADHGMGIVGCASLEVYSLQFAEVRSLAVLPAFRESGLAERLVEQCREEAKRLRVREVFSLTDQISVFESVGFVDPLPDQRAMFLNLGRN